MIWIVMWLLVCFEVVLALSVRATWRDVKKAREETADARRKLAEIIRDDLK